MVTLSASVSSLAQPALLPDFDRPSGLPVFQSVKEAIATYEGETAIHVLYPRTIARAAATFLDGFPGKVLYAVKANPHPAILRVLASSGIRDFDIASIREIDLVRSTVPGAVLYLMHPVKSRRTVRYAYAAGVRHMAFDCLDELSKIFEETDGAGDLTLHLRLAVPNGHAAMPLAGKFGATFEDAVTCLQKARPACARLGVSFHVGSQCMDVADYRQTLAYVRKLVDQAGVAIDSIDCGGGFPVTYPGMTPPPLTTYFSTIKAALRSYGFEKLEILGEPGRALCAEGGSTLTRVELRKGQDLYLNDGGYGSLYDAARFDWNFPAHRVGDPAGTANNGAEFRLFGPTCDASDVIAKPFRLPADIQEGDWIEIGHLGAYGQALSTNFNGFQSDTTVAVMA